MIQLRLFWQTRSTGHRPSRFSAHFSGWKPLHHFCILLFILAGPVAVGDAGQRLLAQSVPHGSESFTSVGPYRFIRFVAESEVNGNPWSSMAEFYVLDQHGEAIDRSEWQIRFVGSEEKLREDGDAENAIDGDESTHWHTEWSISNPAHPHEIVFDMRKPYEISGFRYLPRQDNSVNGRVAAYSFYATRRLRDEYALIDAGALENRADEQTILFQPADSTPTPIPATETPTVTPSPTATTGPTATPTLPTNSPKSGAVRGVVWYDWNHDQQRDEEELLLEDFRVTLTWAGPDNVIGTDDDVEKSDRTNRRGEYSKSSLSAGLYLITVEASAEAVGSDQQLVVKNAGSVERQQQLAPGEELDNFDFPLHSGDLDGDLISDSEEGQDDYDGDGAPNYADADADNDERPDREEGTQDRNNNGLRDFLDSAPPDGQPQIQVIKTDFLLIDADANGVASADDTILYRIDVINNSSQTLKNVVLLDSPDALSNLAPGSVQSNRGQINRGNASEDGAVEIALGDVAAGEAATVSFQVQVTADVVIGRLQNQALIQFAIVSGTTSDSVVIRSDDPDAPGNADATVTVVGAESIQVIHMPLVIR